MATDIPMPKLGLTMEEATIVEWLVDDGDVVETNQPILLIETDKTATEVGSPGSGRLHQIGQRGDVYPCGHRIGWLLAEGETPPEPPAPTNRAAPAGSTSTRERHDAASPSAPVAVGATTPGRVLASPNARRVAAERGVSLRATRGTGPGGRIVSEDVLSVPVGAPVEPVGHRVVATFAAHNLADLVGVDITQVPVDPIEQRITRDGVARYVRTLLQQLTTPSTAAAMPLLQQPSETIRLSGMRGTIAKRMHASLREMAQLTLTMDADMTAVVADRDRRRASGAAPSITDYVVAATARALTTHPRMNAQVTGSGIALLPGVHVGLAVAVENGLVVPVIRDAARRDLRDLAEETSRLAEAARRGTLSPGELEGGTFSVSALGAFGVHTFTPVINPPNAGILGVGQMRDDVVVDGGQVTTVKRLTLSLTWDHRVLDGVPAAEFCRTIVALLADPVRLD